MSDLANRLRKLGVSNERLFQIDLARRAPEVGAKATDADLALAHEFNELLSSGKRIQAAALRASAPRAVDRGRAELSRIDEWLQTNDIAAKHGFSK